VQLSTPTYASKNKTNIEYVEYGAELASWAETLFICLAALNDDADSCDDDEEENLMSPLIRMEKPSY
jgi:hypothetical protein